MAQLWFSVFSYFLLLTNCNCDSFFEKISKTLPKLLHDIVNATGLPKFFVQNVIFNSEELPNFDIEDGSQFDFIVVGAGSAGAVVASRLSEANVTVLLIEAGGKEMKAYDLPFGTRYHRFPQLFWDLRSEPSDKHCLGMENKSCDMVQGKVVGGSSVIVAKVATRGNSEDYDDWARMGNEGWSYNEVLKYFKKLETNTAVDYKNYDAELRGSNGPVTISMDSR